MWILVGVLLWLLVNTWVSWVVFLETGDTTSDDLKPIIYCSIFSIPVVYAVLHIVAEFEKVTDKIKKKIYKGGKK